MTVDSELVTEIDLAITSAAPAEESNEESNDLSSEGGTEAAHESEDEDTGAGEATGTEEDQSEAGEGEGESEGDSGGSEEAQQQISAEPTISDYALSRAAAVGISSDHAGEFQSAESLLAEVRHLESRAMTEQQAVRGAEQKAEPAADPLVGLPDLDPEDHDPGVIEMFNGLKDIIKGQNEQFESLRQSQESAAQANQNASDREVESWFDASINSLAEELGEEALGVGRHGDQAPGSRSQANRNAIAEQCSVLLAGNEALGQTTTREEVFRVASKLVLADEYQKLHENELSAGLEKQAGKHISRAGGKANKSNQSPEAAVAALLDEKYG